MQNILIIKKNIIAITEDISKGYIGSKIIIYHMSQKPQAKRLYVMLLKDR